MCGRFTLRAKLNKILQEMGVDGDGPEWDARYNIAPTQVVPVVRAADDGGPRTCELLRWGLVPSWAKDPKAVPRGGLINARGETVATQPSFRSAFRKRRCLVLADGYYEWKAGATPKQPFLFHRPADEPFAFAGLWERWRGETGPALETFTLITTEANAATAAIHDRMPVILDDRDWGNWLDSDAEPAELQSLLRPYPPDGLATDAVSTTVNNPRNDSPDCVQVVSH